MGKLLGTRFAIIDGRIHTLDKLRLVSETRIDEIEETEYVYEAFEKETFWWTIDGNSRTQLRREEEIPDDEVKLCKACDVLYEEVE